MKFQVYMVASFLAMATISTTFAQFDFGGLIQGRAQQAIQRFENRIQQHLPQIIPPQTTYPIRPAVEVLPYQPTYPTQPQYQDIPHYTGPVQMNQPQIVHRSVVTNPVAQPAKPKTDPESKPTSRPLPKVDSGTLVNVSGRTYGNEQGNVYVKIDSLVIKAELLKWTNERVQARLPYMDMLNPVKATVIVVASDDKIADKAEIAIMPADKPEDTSEKKVKTPAAPTVYAGQRLNIRGDLGVNQGRVELRIGTTTMLANITNWTPERVSFELPSIALAGIQKADVVVISSENKVARTVPVEFAPAKK